MVAICCGTNQTEYLPDQLSGALPMVGGSNGGLTYSATPTLHLPPLQRPNPSYLYPSSLNATTYGPDMSFYAMPWSDPSLLAPIQKALMSLNRTTCPGCTISAAQSSSPYSRWTTPYDLGVTEGTFITTGVLNGTGSCVSTSPYSLDNAISTLVCPPGFFRLSRAAIANSCNASGLTCPSWALACLCKPCAPVPPQPLVITITTGRYVDSSNGESDGSVTSAPCSKLVTCAQIRQQDEVTITVADAYGPQLRGLLDIATPQAISFRYSLDPSSRSAPSSMALVTPALADGTVGAVWQGILPSPQLGFWLLTVLADGVAVRGSPTVLQVRCSYLPAPLRATHLFLSALPLS